jgi:hypothetical protein
MGWECNIQELRNTQKLVLNPMKNYTLNYKRGIKLNQMREKIYSCKCEFELTWFGV